MNYDGVFNCAYNSIRQWHICAWQLWVLYSQLTTLNDSESHPGPSAV